MSHNNLVPSLEEMIEGRLAELLYAGYITPSVYQAADIGSEVALGIMMGYLDTCLDLPAVH